MRKILTYISLITVALSCTACKFFLNEETKKVEWNKVDTACLAIKTVARTSTYAVCVKNKDLPPVFKAIGEGLVVMSGSATEEQMTPEQINSYIAGLLDSNKWGSLGSQITAITNDVISCYTSFCEANKDNFNDKAKVLSKVIKSIGEGFIQGSNISPIASGKDTPETAKLRALVDYKTLDLIVTK